MRGFIISAKKISISLGAVLFWLVVWQIVSTVLGSELLLVSPLQAVKSFWGFLLKADFWKTVAFSVGRIGLGFIMGVILGIILAVAAFFAKIVEVLIYPLFQAVKSVPVVSFTILCLVWISAGNLAIFISFLMVVPIVYTNILEGIRNIDQGLIEVAKVFKIPFRKRLFFIYVSQMMPYMKAACAISLGMCWKAGIAAEVIGTPSGSIGEKLYISKVYLNMPELFAWTLVIIIISIIFEKMIIGTLQLILYWMEHR